MQTRAYDPASGQAFQGDIAIIPLPEGVAVATNDEIQPIDGRLIVQEGEVTGHHHKIVLPRAVTGRNFAPDTRVIGDAAIMTDSPRLKRHFGGGKGASATPTARMYRDPAAVAELQRLGILTRADLAIGILIVEGGSVVLGHEEHDGVRLLDKWTDGAGNPRTGRYYIGRQIESAGAEERVVAD